jgi:hypothetical protein
MDKTVLNVPPFPPLQGDEFFWMGEVVLRSWRGFQARRRPYGAVSSHLVSDGSTNLTVTPQDEKARLPPTPEQVRAYQYLLDHEKAVRNSVLRAVFDYYPGERDLSDSDEEESEELIPEIERVGDLRRLIGLSNVHVLAVTKNGLSFLGLEFGCAWDREHGLAVMTHKDRVVAVGGAHVSFLEWIAREDAESGK